MHILQSWKKINNSNFLLVIFAKNNPNAALLVSFWIRGEQ